MTRIIFTARLEKAAYPYAVCRFNPAWYEYTVSLYDENGPLDLNCSTHLSVDAASAARRLLRKQASSPEPVTIMWRRA